MKFEAIFDEFDQRILIVICCFMVEILFPSFIILDLDNIADC